jgi:Holliday junction resolvase
MEFYPKHTKGIRKEQDIVKEARERGLLAFRSAGSHSPIDVCIIDKHQKKIFFIQCKPRDMSEKLKNRLEAEHADLNNFYECCFIVK